jgi:hypothetical protein
VATPLGWPSLSELFYLVIVNVFVEDPAATGKFMMATVVSKNSHIHIRRLRGNSSGAILRVASEFE